VSATSPKTYSEAISASEGTRPEHSKLSASEGTRSEPTRAAKTAKTTAKRSKKQYVSPEIVPSEWDRDSDDSSKSDKTKITKKSTKKPVESAPKTSDKPIEVSKNPTDKDEQAVKTQSTIIPPKKKQSVPSKPKDPLPSVDPFKSKEKVSKLIDKDSISHLTFKKNDCGSQKEIRTSASAKINAKGTTISPVQIERNPLAKNSVSEAAKTFLNGPITFNKPIERSNQKSLDNYFIPQGRTGQSVSSRSSVHPQDSTTSEFIAPSDNSDLDIITGLFITPIIVKLVLIKYVSY
jgi:hypothetical protein